MKENPEHVKGVKIGISLTLHVLPLLFAFMVGGLVQVLVPHEVLSQWIGKKPGIGGIILNSIAEGFAPYGPCVSFPVAGALLKAGASA